MKRMGVVPLDFKSSTNGPVPVDSKLFSLATEYCQANLSEQPDLLRMGKTWVVAEFEGEQIVSVHGLSCYGGNVPDIPIFRVTGDNAKRATQMLYDRMNGYFADNGMRGHQVFLFINEKETPEQRCQSWEQSLKEVGSTPAMRMAVVIR